MKGEVLCSATAQYQGYTLRCSLPVDHGDKPHFDKDVVLRHQFMTYHSYSRGAYFQTPEEAGARIKA